MYIYQAGECQVSDIGARTDVSNAAASQLVERLVHQEWVERREDPTNRRTKILKLSGKGKKLIRDSVISNNFLLDMMASLTPDQNATIRTAFSNLAQAAHHIQELKKGKVGDHA